VTRAVPFLAICIGMQLLYDESEESPGVGSRHLPDVVRRLPKGVKHPQMQWNTLDIKRESMLFHGDARPRLVLLRAQLRADDIAHASAMCDYGGPVVAAVERGNVWARSSPGEVGSQWLAVAVELR